MQIDHLGQFPSAVVSFNLAQGSSLGEAVTAIKQAQLEIGLPRGVITAFLIGNLVGTLPSGWMVDRFGRRPVIIAGPLLTAATSLAIFYIYQQAFQFNEYGYAAAMASVLVVVLMALTVLMFFLTQGGRFTHE